MKAILFTALFFATVATHAQERWQQRGDSLQQELQKHTAEDTLKVKMLVSLANIYRHNEPGTALDYGQQALKLAEKIGDKKGEAGAYNNMGLAYERQGKYDKALKSYDASLAIKADLKEMNGIGASLCNKGIVYLDKKDYAQALEMLNEAKRTFESMPGNHDSDECLGNTMTNLGLVYIKQTRIVSADKEFEGAYQIFARLGNKGKTASACIHLAATRVVLEKYDDAGLYANKALALAKEMNDDKIEEQANKVLDKIKENNKR